MNVFHYDEFYFVYSPERNSKSFCNNKYLTKNKRGRSLAWSRILALGASDSGSNPGGPISRPEAQIFFENLLSVRDKTIQKRKQVAKRKTISYNIDYWGLSIAWSSIPARGAGDGSSNLPGPIH